MVDPINQYVKIKSLKIMAVMCVLSVDLHKITSDSHFYKPVIHHIVTSDRHL